MSQEQNESTLPPGVVLPSSVHIEYCTAAFEDLILESSDEDVRDSYTASVAYDKGKLLDWLNDDCSDADTVKMVFGRYTTEFKNDVDNAFNNDEITNRVKVGRLTTILVAYNGTAVIGAFDVGSLQP